MSTPAPKSGAASKGARSLAELRHDAAKAHEAGHHDEAEELYVRILARLPDDSVTWSNYGALLRSRGQLGPAIAAHRRARNTAPDDLRVINNLSNALADDGRFGEALGLRTRLLAAEPRSTQRLRDVCAALRGLGRNEEVIERVDRAEAEGWADGECFLQRALARLMLGEYAAGFADFEYRYAGDEVRLPQNVPWPRWMGEPVDGKRIVITAEQGFGDAILMARFIPRLQSMGAEVCLYVKPPMKRIFSALPGVTLVEGVRASDRFDFYTPNMSLPHLVGMEPDGSPPPAPPLHIPEDSRARARALTAPFEKHLRVGIVWTGSLTYKANNRRSTTPESFLGLACVPGVQLFSLYKGPAHEAFTGSGMNGLILDACSSDRDFADSAAVIEEMDLMITTDTAVVHIAGSLGKPIWNMLSHDGFWLYGRGETTPWYPTMRLWRQEAPGDWEGVFQRVEVALHDRVANRPAAARR